MTRIHAVAGAVYERDGRRRAVVRLIPPTGSFSAAVEWRRPGQEMRTTTCSIAAFNKWLSLAQLVS